MKAEDESGQDIGVLTCFHGMYFTFRETFDDLEKKSWEEKMHGRFFLNCT